MARTAEPTTLELALLGLLALEPRSGYDLMSVFETTAMGNYSSSPGAIYPALKRLERRGLIEGEVDDTQPLRPRKIFEPTRQGRGVLDAWLRRDLSRDDVGRRLDELLLRFAFHSLLEPAATRTFLTRFGEAIEAYLRELEEQRAVFPTGAPSHGLLAFEFGIEQYRSCARWVRRTLRQFEEESS